MVVYLEMNVYFPCFTGLSQVDWNSLKNCPTKIQTKTIIPVLFFSIQGCHKVSE